MKPMKSCRKCGRNLKAGKALQNSLVSPSGKRIERGVTISRTGPPQMVSVLKCTNCGHSFTI